MMTDLPTEPGVYLFCGSRRRVTGIRCPHRAELVRVGRMGNGETVYIGNELFYPSDKPVGAWLRIDVGELEALGRAQVLEAFAKGAAEAFQGEDMRWGGFAYFLERRGPWRVDEAQRAEVMRLAEERGWIEEGP